MPKACCDPRRAGAGGGPTPARPTDHELERLVAVTKALADPARLRMLALMVQGRDCCGLPEPAARGVPGGGDPRGICVCELQGELGLGQSTASYHLRVLRDAGLVREEARGKWTFYELDEPAVRTALAGLRDLLRV